MGSLAEADSHSVGGFAAATSPERGGRIFRLWVGFSPFWGEYRLKGGEGGLASVPHKAL